jgi:hypothetical protein
MKIYTTAQITMNVILMSTIAMRMGCATTPMGHITVHVISDSDWMKMAGLAMILMNVLNIHLVVLRYVSILLVAITAHVSMDSN